MKNILNNIAFYVRLFDQLPISYFFDWIDITIIKFRLVNETFSEVALSFYKLELCESSSYLEG